MLSNTGCPISAFLLVLVMAGARCAPNSIGLPGGGGGGGVRDLTVALHQEGRRLPEKFESNELYKSLKLNISWCPPLGGTRLPSSYSVVVTSLTEEDPTDCPEGSIFYTSKDNKELSILLPQTSGIIDMSEMHVFPGCSYRIQVHANPRLKASIETAQTIYKVPDCVSGKCNCLSSSSSSSRSTLPTPKVNLVATADGLSIQWDVFNNHSNIHFYTISIGHRILTSRNGRAVYNMTKIGKVYAPDTAFQLTRWENGPDREIADLKISVVAVDFRGCFGDEGSLILPAAPLEASSAEIIWFVLGGAIALCATITILLLVRSRANYKLIWESRSLPRIQPLSKCKSDWAESILNKQNILYVRYEPQVEAEAGSESDQQLRVSFKNLSLVEELGRGQFGKVYLGRLDDREGTLVAVKRSSLDQLDETESRKEFMEEIEIMRLAGTHPNLVGLIGYCSEPHQPISIILEYMDGGDLLAYLHSRRKTSRARSHNDSQSSSGRSSRPSISETLYTTLSYVSGRMAEGNPIYSSMLQQTRKYINVSEAFALSERENGEEFEEGSIGRKEFLGFSMDIANGMAHLEAKGITHRDLAARNILMGSDFTLKISDFGLSRNGLYVITTKGTSKARHLPIRWMSPEAIRDRAFSTKSDVWSFAIVLWEIGTLGSFPYPSIRDDRLLRHILWEDARLDRPETISLEVYSLMERCWATEPEDRPTFQQILSQLRSINLATTGPTSADNPCYLLPPPLPIETFQS